jgi:hypothetical protein
MRSAKSSGSRSLKVQPAQRDLERLKPFLLEPSLFKVKDALSRWQSAAELGSASNEFRDKIYEAIVHLLIGSIAANRRVHPHDRREIENRLRREREARRLIARACELYGSQPGSARRELESVHSRWIAREAELKHDAQQIAELRRGRAPYGAFAKFVRLVGEAYESTTNQPAIVKINYGRANDKRCSGPFGALLEAARADASAIWEKASFGTSLNGPRDPIARLEYARKVMIESRANHRSG